MVKSYSTYSQDFLLNFLYTLINKSRNQNHYFIISPNCYFIFKKQLLQLAKRKESYLHKYLARLKNTFKKYLFSYHITQNLNSYKFIQFKGLLTF